MQHCYLSSRSCEVLHASPGFVGKHLFWDVLCVIRDVPDPPCGVYHLESDIFPIVCSDEECFWNVNWTITIKQHPVFWGQGLVFWLFWSSLRENIRCFFFMLFLLFWAAGMETVNRLDRLHCLWLCCNFPPIAGFLGNLDHLCTLGNWQTYRFSFFFGWTFFLQTSLESLKVMTCAAPHRGVSTSVLLFRHDKGSAVYS